MDSAGGPILAGEQIMQINKQNRNMNIYGYDILIGRDADSTRGILGFWACEFMNWQAFWGFAFGTPAQLARARSHLPRWSQGNTEYI